MTEQTKAASRIFKTGTTKIVEDETMQGLTNEQGRDLLKRTYPEVANATVREQTLEDERRLVEFLPQPGRKG